MADSDEKALEAAGTEKSGDLTDAEKDKIKRDIEKKYELSTSELEEGEGLDELAELLESRREEFAKGVEGFDEAEKEFYRVLRIDKYNRAARRWLERIEQSKSATE